MREIRYLDKLVDELAKGKAMEKILRTESSNWQQKRLVFQYSHHKQNSAWKTAAQFSKLAKQKANVAKGQ